MKAPAEIAAFWRALPDSAPFASLFASAIEAVEQADLDARRADEAARVAKARHRDAVADLRQRAEAAAQADWTPAEIDAARKAALRQAFAIAAQGTITPPTHDHACHGKN